ncbi:Uncharacterised protein [Burkholderia pseudomallei]|nr:Uncharacterised protein [Burkholderia pseudomallei]
MPMVGLSHANASAFAMLAPTSSAPARPGPCVNAIASMSSRRAPLAASTSSSSGSARRMWSRDASSGTTPPYSRCIAICE